MSIRGKIALVTGAGQGIGRGIALRLAKDDADIAVIDVNEEKMHAVADEVKALGRKATTFKANVSKRGDVYAAIDHAEKELGGFDIIVNNAGIAQIKSVSEVMSSLSQSLGYAERAEVESRQRALRGICSER